jgi:Asp-tRNA(Asn)/Glu-tRNA(Gln) amidotransferase A subunit family amidase
MTDGFETRLAPLVQAFCNGNLGLSPYLEQLETFFEAENDRIEAFLPEDGRFVRLHREAVDLLTRYPEPDSRPALFGVPLGVKDIFHVEGFPTRAGSKLPVEILAGTEAESVTLLKQAGALILGKTVTTEFAYFAPGPTRNPHNTGHTPGGSSSGSAAAVSAGLCPLALGTQTVGSVIRPASFCGTVGFKPTSGRIPTGGVIPLSVTLDHIGFFTRDLAGSALAAASLCQAWQPQSVEPGRPVLGIPTGPLLDKASTSTLNHFQESRIRLQTAGFEVRAVEAMPNFDEIVSWHMDLMAAEAAAFHEEWFAEFGDRYHPKTSALIERGHQVAPNQARAYRAGRQQLRRDLEALMDNQGISLWISPSAVGAAPAGLDSTGDPVMNLAWTYAGLPAVNLPNGEAENGLPLGLQLVGGWNQDEKLLMWAGQIAQALG